MSKKDLFDELDELEQNTDELMSALEEGSDLEEEEEEEAGKPEYPLGHTYQLRSPIVTSKGEITEFAFSKEIKTQHVMNFPASEDQFKFLHAVHLVRACTGQPKAVLEQVKSYDMTELIKIAMSFFAYGPLLTGESE